LLIPSRRDSIRLGSPINKCVVRSYQDITITEVAQPGREKTVNRTYAVRIATDPRAMREFRDLDAARDYFDGLVLQRLNCITTARLRHH
jgi:hypothetical protein